MKPRNSSAPLPVAKDRRTEPGLTLGKLHDFLFGPFDDRLRHVERQTMGMAEKPVEPVEPVGKSRFWNPRDHPREPDGKFRPKGPGVLERIQTTISKGPTAANARYAERERQNNIRANEARRFRARTGHETPGDRQMRFEREREYMADSRQ